MHQNEIVLRRFFDGLNQHDIDKIAGCYDQHIVFSSPIFPTLRGQDVIDMWRMLILHYRDLQITLDTITADDSGGHVIWQAQYRNAQTGRSITNKISALFAFRHGLIVRHIDRFSFWAWSRQTFGMVGQFFGWSWPMKSLVRKKAMIALRRFN